MMEKKSRRKSEFEDRKRNFYFTLLPNLRSGKRYSRKETFNH